MEASTPRSSIGPHSHRRMGSVFDEPPWFLRLDHEDEVEYDATEDRLVKCGTLTGLVEQLTRHDRLDSSFNEAFLMTYRTFTSAHQLFDLLVQRFDIQVPAGLDEFDTEYWMERKQQTVRMRVVNVLRHWLERYWMEPQDEKTTSFLRHAQTTINDSPAIMKTPTTPQLLATIDRRIQGHEPIKRLTRTPTNPIPPPIVPKNTKKLKLLEINPLEFARQLTILESHLYTQIKPTECLNKGWQHKPPTETPTGINAMILHANKLANWVGQTILYQSNMKKRVAAMKYFVSVADHCRTLNNYATLMSIVSGLGLAPVYRLHMTWSQVSRRVFALLEDMRGLMASSRNFVAYREALRGSSPPCVPFLGIYLTDLTFIEDGNPNLTPSGAINFTKRFKTAEIISDIQQHQNTPYAFQLVPDLQDFILQNLQSAGDVHEMYDRSLELEPRQQGEENVPETEPYVATGSHMSSVLIASMVLRS